MGYYIAARPWKLIEFSRIYWSNLVNRIDFPVEISHYCGSVGGIKTTKAKYLILLNFLGKMGLD